MLADRRRCSIRVLVCTICTVALACVDINALRTIPEIPSDKKIFDIR